MKAILIDDERMARQELRRLLVAHPQIEIAGEARNGDEALRMIEEHSPDVLFLDVRMPGMSGFDMLEQLDSVPQVIFTTAFDQYALKAFEVSALDYLVKPVAPERLAKAIGKLKPPAQRGGIERVFVRDGERCWLVRLHDIRLLRSEGNYTRLYFEQNQPLIPRSLAHIEPRLDEAMFFRANRAEIVNLKWVVSIEPDGDGYAVALRGGPVVAVSRRQARLLRDRLAF